MYVSPHVHVTYEQKTHQLLPKTLKRPHHPPHLILDDDPCHPRLSVPPHSPLHVQSITISGICVAYNGNRNRVSNQPPLVHHLGVREEARIRLGQPGGGYGKP